MASVFLSYDRQDAAKAQRIASALETAGHSVWWDRHIKSGAQYSKEIEQALQAADAVVVLWSERSVDSAWVRDEAAAGRDTGRLVPVIIGKTGPPLGFRQYQTTDLSRWKGKPNSASFQEMLGAVEALGSGENGERLSAASKRATPRLNRHFAIAGAIAVILIAALIFWRPWHSLPVVPVIAVRPADGSQAAAGLANDLFVQLGSFQSSNANALQLVEQSAEARPDLIFKIGANVSGQQAGVNLALLRGQGGNLMWSRDFPPAVRSPSDLKQQVAYTAALVLQCASEALSAKGKKLDPQTLTLYLNGCADLSTSLSDDPRNLIPLFIKVTRLAPQFEGGWANLLLAETEVLSNPDSQDLKLERRLRRHVAEARLVNPSLAESFLAEASLSPRRPISGWMGRVEKAVELNPDHAPARAELSRVLMYVGRLRESVSEARRAVQLAPLSPHARDALISAFTYSGQFDAAMKELDDAERIWPGASNLVATRYRLQLRYGNPQAAFRTLRSGVLNSPASPMQDSFLRARMEPTAANIERAVSEALGLQKRFPGAFSTVAQTLAEFGRDDEIVEMILTNPKPEDFEDAIEVLFRPPFRELHSNPRFMAVAQRLGLLDYWRQSGEWPDFCYRSDLPYDCKSEAAKLAA